MRYHPKEPTHRVYWECLGAVCDILFPDRRTAEKMREWLSRQGRNAWITAL